MAEPLPAYLTAVDPRIMETPPPSRFVRARRALRGSARAVLGWSARPARLIPGLGAISCAVAGSWLLWGLGVALLVAVPFLLLLDARTPRG